MMEDGVSDASIALLSNIWLSPILIATNIFSNLLMNDIFGNTVPGTYEKLGDSMSPYPCLIK